MSAIRQHLIDPEICIRCDTCEQTCPIDAITHDTNNYVVDTSICNYCMDCVATCPTGAIDNWRIVRTAYSLEEQFEWDELPEQENIEEETDTDHDRLDPEITDILTTAHSAEGGAVAPASASRPSVNLYTRKSPAIATVAGNYRITDADAESDIRHIILDFGKTAFPVLEGQSIGITPSGQDENGRPHHVRLYSVASPRNGERPNHNNLALTVKRVIYDEEGIEKRGVASNFVCDLSKGDRVEVTGPFGDTFLMPTDPVANLVMICTGTGAAPFRAMTEYRRRHMSNAPGKLLLFFGARRRSELPYFGPLMKLPDTLIQKELVFSREGDSPKEYVQDRMRRCADDIARLLESDRTHVYICGLKGMEQGVAESLEWICERYSLDWSELQNEMRKTGRYHVETY